jgi:ligand-binding sensor domain-containing protein
MNNFFNRFLFFPPLSVLIICILYVTLHASDLNGSDFKFDHLTMEQGLSYNAVEVIIQDHKGYLWIGTRNGLNRYDGYEIKVFSHDPDNPHSLRDNVIEAIFEDRLGTLWIGTQNGWLEKYDRNTGQFSHYQLGTHVQSIMEGNDSTFWIGTLDPGLIHFNPTNSDTSIVRTFRNIKSILEDQQRKVWVVSPNRGVGKYDPVSKHFKIVNVGASVGSAIELGPGMFWFGTYHDGIIEYNSETREKRVRRHDPENKNSISGNNISSLYRDKSGRIWIGTVEDGLNCFEPSKNLFTHFRHDPGDPRSINHNMISTIFQDRSGVIWIGTVFGGVNKLSDRQLGFIHHQHDPQNSNSLSSNVVNAIYQDRKGILWIGTDRGLNCFDRPNNKWTHYFNKTDDPHSLGDNLILSIYEDKNGSLWIGTGAGLDRYDNKRGIFLHYQIAPAHAIIEDNAGHLLLATKRGLYRFVSGGDPEFILMRSGYCWKISLLLDRQGMLWVGSSGCGVELYNPSTNEWHLYEHNPENTESISDNFIESILEVQNGDLWFGTAGGLNFFNRKTKTFTHFREKDGLGRDWIKAVLEDQQEFLWMSTDDGLSRFDPDTKKFNNYPVDQLNNHSFRRGAYYKNDKGEMFFGGSEGFNTFHPQDIRDNPHPPPVVITRFNLFNRLFQEDVPANEFIDLNYNQNFLSFDFAALDFTDQKKNQHAYMMEGLDEDWNYVGNRRHADYPDLKPGNYIFRVKGSNNDGIWNESGVSLSIKIFPPFWQTWWFRTIILLSVIVAALAMYKRRVSTLESKRKDLEIRVREKTEAAEALQNANVPSSCSMKT